MDSWVTWASCVLIAAMGIFGMGRSQAQSSTYPSRPITFVYPYTAGSGADVAWRTINAEAAKRLGQPIVQENRVGAGGRVGLLQVLKSPADGHMLAFINNPLAVYGPLMEPSNRLDVGTDYTAITNTMETYLLLAAHPSVPFRDVKGLISYAKANPGKLNGASSGPGTGGHLGIEFINSLAGVKVTHVPFAGTAAALSALLGAQVDLLLVAGTPKPYVDAGKLVAIGTSGPKRWSVFPGVPTIAEGGIPRYNLVTWTGVAGPPGMPREIVQRLAKVYSEAVRTPEVHAKMLAGGWEVTGGTPEEFVAQIRADFEMYAPLIKAAKIKFDQ